MSSARPESPPGRVEGSREAPSVRVIRLVKDRTEDLIFDGEHGYAVVAENGHIRTLALGSKAFRRWVRAQAIGDASTPPGIEALKTAEGTLEAEAERSGVRPAPTIRVAGEGSSDEPVVFVDLSDDSWRCVRITPSGWEIVPHPAGGPFMYRPPRQAALPTPRRSDGPLAERVEMLWNFVNVTREADRRLYLAALVGLWSPKGPYPVLAIHGAQDSGKTTTVCATKALTDPTKTAPEVEAPTSPKRPPREERDVEAAAYSSRVMAYDNVSYLDQWLSDAICRLATGAELGGRELYSNFDEAILSAARPVILNGIPDVVGQSDLADRTIKIETRRPEHRLSETEFWDQFRSFWPDMVATLCDLTSVVLRNWPEAGDVTSDTVRMSDFARLGEALGVELGWEPGQFTADYAANRSEAAREIGELDVVYDPLVSVLRKAGGSWEGPLGELLKELNDVGPKDPPRSWPKTARALASHFQRSSPSLSKAGIEVEKLPRSNGKAPWRVREVHSGNSDEHS